MRVAANFNGKWRAHVYYQNELILVTVACLDFLHAQRCGWELGLQYMRDWRAA
jgi:hypothetical protein